MIGRYVVEAGVLVPSRAAYLLDPILDIEGVRRRYRGEDQMVDGVLSGWRETSLGYARGLVGSVVGTSVDENVRAGGPFSAKEVAAMADIGERAVLKAVADGRLLGAKFAGCWSFAPSDVATFLAKRAS